MSGNFKRRLDRIEDVLRPTKNRPIEDLTDEELLEIIGVGPDVSDERLLEIIMEGRSKRKLLVVR